MLSTPDMKSITAKVVIHNNTPLSIILSLFILLSNLIISIPCLIYQIWYKERVGLMVSLLISIWINPSFPSFIFVELFSCFFTILEVSNNYSTSNWYNSYTTFKGMLPTKDYSPSHSPYGCMYLYFYDAISVALLILLVLNWRHLTTINMCLFDCLLVRV